MAKNQTGIAIVIKAFLPTGSTIDEQFAALSIVKDAHASGDYTALLKAAQIDEIKTEQKTRRVEDEPATMTGNSAGTAETEQPQDEQTRHNEPTTAGPEENEPTDDAVPDFLKPGKRKTA